MAKKKARKKPVKKAKKKAAKKPARKPKKKAPKKAARKAKPSKAAKPVKSTPAAQPRKKLGEVTHFYSHISVAVVRLDDTLRQGDNISIEGATTNFRQKVDSMQIDHDAVQEAKKGQEIGMKVVDKVRQGDTVYKA